MRKIAFMPLFMLIMVFVIVVPAFAAEREVEVHAGRLAELQDVVLSMVAEKEMEIVQSRGVDFRQPENLHLHPNYQPGVDPRFALLSEMSILLWEANSNIVAHNHVDPLGEIRAEVITKFAPPGSAVIESQKFHLYFISEEFFVLIALISEFTGIEKEMFVLGVSEPFVLPRLQWNYGPTPWEAQEVSLEYQGIDEIYTEVGIATYESLEERRFATTLSMGMTIIIRHPNGGWLAAPLGHGTSASGAMAYTTNHGVIPARSRVELTNGVHIGTINRFAFNPAAGLDVSLITLNNDFVVSPLVPGTSTRITNFFGSPAPVGPVSVTVVFNRTLTT